MHRVIHLHHIIIMSSLNCLVYLVQEIQRGGGGLKAVLQGQKSQVGIRLKIEFTPIIKIESFSVGVKILQVLIWGEGAFQLSSKV